MGFVPGLGLPGISAPPPAVGPLPLGNPGGAPPAMNSFGALPQLDFNPLGSVGGMGPMPPPKLALTPDQLAGIGETGKQAAGFEDAANKYGLAQQAAQGKIPVPPTVGTPEDAGAAPGGDEGGGPPMPPPAQYVAAHWDPRRNPLRAETLTKIDEAHQGERAGLQSEADTAARGFDEQRATWENYQRIQENQKLLELQAQQKREDATKAQEMRIDEAMQEARDARVNPNRIQEGFGAPEWISCAAGAAASGLYQGYMQTMLGTNVENEFQKSYQRMVDNDINKQKQEVAAKQQGVTNAVNTFDRMKARFGDDMQAEAATRAYYAESMKTELARVAAQTNSEAARANAQTAIATMDENQAKDMGKLRDMAEFVPAQVIGGAGTGGAGTGAADKARGKIFEYGGKRYEARDEKTANEMAAGAAAVAEIERLAKQIDKARDDKLTFVPGTSEGAHAETVHQQLTFAIKKAQDLGAISASDAGMMINQLGTPTGLFSRSGQRALETADLSKKAFQDRLRSQATEQVQTGYKATATGQIAPTAAYTGSSPTKTALPSTFKAQ